MNSSFKQELTFLVCSRLKSLKSKNAHLQAISTAQISRQQLVSQALTLLSIFLMDISSEFMLSSLAFSSASLPLFPIRLWSVTDSQWTRPIHPITVIGSYMRQARMKSGLGGREAVMLQGIELNSNQGGEMKEGFGPGGEKILLRAGYSIITHLNFLYTLWGESGSGQHQRHKGWVTGLIQEGNEFLHSFCQCAEFIMFSETTMKNPFPSMTLALPVIAKTPSPSPVLHTSTSNTERSQYKARSRW